MSGDGEKKEKPSTVAVITAEAIAEAEAFAARLERVAAILPPVHHHRQRHHAAVVVPSESGGGGGGSLPLDLRAASAFEAASRLVPQDAMPHVNVGASLLQMGRAKQAAAHFRHALALASEYRPRTGDGARQREAAERARRGLQIANDALEVVEGP